MLVIGSEIDSSTERIINYLSDTYRVGINAATFQYFKDKNNEEYLSRVFLIEPSEVQYKSTMKSSSKRKPNLTYEQLQEIADNNGAGELYQQVVEELSKMFDKTRRTRSSITFVGVYNDSKKAMFNLIPQESNHEEGLRYQIYLYRLSSYLDVEPKKLLEFLPKNREEWEYQKSDDIQWSGFTGFFKNRNEINSFIQGLKSLIEK